MTKKKPKTEKAKVARNPQKLANLAAVIASYPAGPDSGLIEMLEAQEGLKLKQLKGGKWQARMAGLTAIGLSDHYSAVTNWGNLARREARKAG